MAEAVLVDRMHADREKRLVALSSVGAAVFITRAILRHSRWRPAAPAR